LVAAAAVENSPRTAASVAAQIASVLNRRSDSSDSDQVVTEAVVEDVEDNVFQEVVEDDVVVAASEPPVEDSKPEPPPVENDGNKGPVSESFDDIVDPPALVAKARRQKMLEQKEGDARAQSVSPEKKKGGGGNKVDLAPRAELPTQSGTCLIDGTIVLNHSVLSLASPMEEN
jgi:hypothetical protein